MLNNIFDFNSFKFSIIIAIYNTGEFLEESIESIIKQTIGFEDVELILVDDGSTDNSKDICLKYTEKYPKNINYIYQENQGQATARNNGMKIAKGKYLNFLDSDDKLESSALERVYNFFEAHYNDVDVVSIPMKFFDRQSGEHILNYKYEKTRLIDLNQNPDYIQLSASSAFFKRKSIKNNKFDTKLIVSEDAIFVNKILLEKSMLGVVSNTSYLYRKRNVKTSTIDSSIKKKEYYIDRSQLFFKALFDYAKDKKGHIPNFIKFTVMYDIQWMFDIPNVSDVLDKDELKQLYSILHELLCEIDDYIILNQKHRDRSLIKTILLFKHQEMKTMKNSSANNVVKQVSNYNIDQLYYHVFYMDGVEVKDDTLHLLGFLKSFFEVDEIKIQAVKINKSEFLDYWVSYFNNNKLAFIKKEFLNRCGQNIQCYLINSANIYNNLKIEEFLSQEINFDLNKYYSFREIKELISNNVIDIDNYNELYEKITNIFIESKSEVYDAEYNDYPFRERTYLNISYNKSFNFECKIPLKINEKSLIKIRVSYEELNFYLDVGINYYSKLTKESFYSKKENYLVKFENNVFEVIPYTYKDILMLEKENIDYLVSKNDSELDEIIEFRQNYLNNYPIYGHKRIWLFMDRPDSAGDNAEELYKYALKQNDGIDKYFIIKKDSKDYNRLKEFANIIEYKSNAHKLLACFAEKIISSHPDDDLLNPFSGRFEKYYNGLMSAKTCFLQHGIILNNISSWLHKYDKFLYLFVTSANEEYNSIFENPYNYDKSVVKLLGLPRYDALHSKHEKNQIVITPTWRRSIREMSDNQILESEYFKRWNNILNHDDLLKFLKKHDYEIIFKPHPNINDCIHLFDLNNVTFDEELSYKDVLNESKLMITDYSSVTFDFAYLKKPIIYYQWKNDDFHFNLSESYFKYDEMGFGETIHDETDLIQLIKEYVLNDCQMKDKYQKRVDNFYKFHDKNNCKRIYDFIINMKK